MNYINRHMEEIVLKLSNEYSAILVTGPRQVGKTTMLKHLIEKEGKGRAVVSLDDFTERNIAKKDPAMFFQLHKPPIFIDEVQYAPELFSYIKMHIDEYQNPGDFWMTGSQIFSMIKGVQESLAGRVALLHLSPLSNREISGIASWPFSIDFDRLVTDATAIKPVTTPQMFQKIWEGSMPGIVSGRFTDRNIYYSSYLSTYLERDVRELSNAIDSLKFLNFITSAAARTGQMVNYSSLAEDANIDQTTAKNWLNILETLGIIFYLHPYSNNTLKRTVKTPKLYFYDTGFVCYLTKWSSPETAMYGAMSGALLENYAVTEIIKSYQNNAKTPYIYYYRNKDAKEIDLILENDGTLCPIEIKKTAMPEKRITRVFDLIDKSPLLRGPGGVLCMASSLSAFDQNNYIIPIWLI
ncbi:MAG: ATP-binding protein [Anaerovoracaceae bacterium]